MAHNPTARRSARALLVCLFAASLFSATSAFGCQIDVPDDFYEMPSWQQRITAEPVVFIGTVIQVPPPEIEGKALIRVDQPIRGITEEYFSVEQGSGGDCRTEYAVGDKLIYAGSELLSPSVYFTDPVTTEQAEKLRFVLRM